MELDKTNQPPQESQLDLQTRLLLDVSRTFALTIPQLPDSVQPAVGNGYLLCRIADTIEDDPGIRLDDKFSFYEEFLNVLNEQADAGAFAARLQSALTSAIPPAEHGLIRDLPQVIAVTRSLPAAQQQALVRCVRVMCNGMYEFQARKSLDGLDTVDDTYRYCYAVAGIVGEMLTDLFCDYSETIAENRTAMLNLSVSFGLGLQLTNIMKDVWEDGQCGSCWLPRSIFRDHGSDLGEIIRSRRCDRLTDGIDDLVGIAHSSLQAALQYTALIPKSEAGIRRFCLWAIGMALQTLQKIYRNPGYENGQQVKISRRRVWAVVLTSNSVLYSNRLIRAWFEIAAFGLPATNLEEIRDPQELRMRMHSTMPHSSLAQRSESRQPQ